MTYFTIRFYDLVKHIWPLRIDLYKGEKGLKFHKVDRHEGVTHT